METRINVCPYTFTKKGRSLTSTTFLAPAEGWWREKGKSE
jgi:hypothetical protein